LERGYLLLLVTSHGLSPQLLFLLPDLWRQLDGGANALIFILGIFLHVVFGPSPAILIVSSADVLGHGGSRHVPLLAPGHWTRSVLAFTYAKTM